VVAFIAEEETGTKLGLRVDDPINPWRLGGMMLGRSSIIDHPKPEMKLNFKEHQ